MSTEAGTVHLAMSLTNLGIRYSQVGRRADAVAPTEEAATLYRDQAAANPAYLPNLAMALNNLGRHRPEAGLPWDADAAWSEALGAMPTPDLKAGLLLEKAERSTPGQATADVLAAVALTPPPGGLILFRVHAACRELRHRDPDLFDHQWQERLATPQPAWLFLEDTTLTTIDDWLQTPTALLARDYHLHHADLLAHPSARTALDELALLGFDPALIGQYRPLLDADGEHGIRAAYQPLILRETLAAWLDADIPDRQRLLAENRDMLLSSQAATLLGQWASTNPGDIALRFGAAMLTLAREGLDTSVLAAANDPAQLGTLLGGLLTAGSTQLLLAATQLLLCLNLDDPTTATAEFYQAAALALTGHTQKATQAVQAAARHDPTATSRWLSILAQQVPAHPQLAPLLQALVARPPGQPDNTASP